MKVRILSSASRDLIEGYRFYEDQAEGVGSRFLDTLFFEIDSLAVTGGIHPLHFEKYHRLLSKKFPFAVYYRVEGQTILIYAVLDCRRNPAWIRRRLAERPGSE